MVKQTRNICLCVCLINIIDVRKFHETSQSKDSKSISKVNFDERIQAEQNISIYLSNNKLVVLWLACDH
jgi:hypothetical protein